MTRSKKKTKRQPNEPMLSLAIEAYQVVPGQSIRAVVKLYGVPRSTLTDRLKGATNQRNAYEEQKRLPDEQEKWLAFWICDQDAIGYPSIHPRVREMATRILAENRDPAPLGKKWVTHFLKRNP